MRVKKFIAGLLAMCIMAVVIPLGAISNVFAASVALEGRLTSQNNLRSFVISSAVVAKCGASTKNSASSEGPSNLFDGGLDNKLGILRSGSESVIITWQMTAATKITAYTIATANDSPERDPKSWNLYGSNNGTDYIVLSTVSDYIAPTQRNVIFYNDFVVETPDEYLYYKFEITDFKNLTSGGYPQLAELILSGVDTAGILAVADLIDAIPGTADNGFSAAVSEAETAFNNLSVHEQSAVYNGDKLAEAIKVRNVALIPEEYRDNVLSVVELIEAIDKTINYTSDKKLNPARAEYDKLSYTAQEYVYNYSNLQAAEVEYTILMDNNFISIDGWDTTKLSNTSWLHSATTEEKADTWQAVADEIKYQYVVKNYDLGLSGTATLREYMGNLNIGYNTADSDNVGNPWGFENNYVSFVIVPFTGMAFSTTGYFGAQFNYQTPLSDSITFDGKVYQQTWSGVRFYDETPLVRGNKVNMTSRDYYPGNTGIEDGSNNTFRYTYATYNQANKWSESFGISLSNAVWMGETLYQEFEGPDGYAFMVNTKDRIEKTNSTSESSMKENAAYVIVGDIADAFVALASNNCERFARTGSALGNRYTDTDGNARQDFEKMSIVIDNSTKEAEIIDGDSIINGFYDSSFKNIWIDDSDIFVLVKTGTVLDRLAPTFSIHTNATVDKAYGSTQDFTNPVTYTVTAENGNTKTYTVTAVLEDSVTKEDRDAADSVSDLIEVMPNKIYRNHRDVAVTTQDEFELLSDKQKLLVMNTDKLLEAKAQLIELNAEPIRITCVGDSITEGVGASDKNMLSYPGQLQTLMGPDCLVTNAGVSGSNAIDTSGYPYITTGRYVTGLSSDPDIVFMMLGTNDAQGQIWNSTAIDAPALFKQDYTKLINEYLSLDSNPKVYLCLPMTCYSDSTRQTNNITGTIPIIKEIAEELDLEVIDMNAFTANHSDWFPDGLHPGDTGYSHIAAEFKTYIKDYIEPYNDVNISGIKLGDTLLEGFDSEKTEYTVQRESFDEFPEVSVLSDNDDYIIEIIKATAGKPVTEINVSSAKFNYGITYTINFASPFMLGDLTGDKQITVTDIVKLRALIMGDSEFTDELLKVGDTTEDGKLTVSDIVKLRSIIMD